jgi:hypothetical protein
MTTQGTQKEMLSQVSVGLMEMAAPLVNCRTVIDVIERDACELQDASDRWSIEAIRGRAKTIAQLAVVLIDELRRADSLQERLSDMMEDIHA